MPLFIPLTTPTNYVSGIVALNIISEDGTGDWHSTDTFFSESPMSPDVFMCGDDYEINTNSLLGNTGIIEVSKQLITMGYIPDTNKVFSANHARACFDLIYRTVIRKNILDFVILDDWFPSLEDKQRVYDLLSIAGQKLTKKERLRLALWKNRNPIA